LEQNEAYVLKGTATADFNGKKNTDIITALALTQSGWTTDSAITKALIRVIILPLVAVVGSTLQVQTLEIGIYLLAVSLDILFQSLLLLIKSYRPSTRHMGQVLPLR
jgi:hypothetical protein